MATGSGSRVASLNAKGSLLAAALAAIGASLCCVGPLVLLGAGIGGAWIGNLTALEPVRPLLIGVTALFVAMAFRRLYIVPQVCEPGTACADPRILKRQRLVFWFVAVSAAGLLAVPWIAPLFY
jgi:mercuric ion transport protein